jgi:putative hydrolase of the HAD superfamily
LSAAGEIRAVLFDVYGTLFVSSAGDVSVREAVSGGAVSGPFPADKEISHRPPHPQAEALAAPLPGMTAFFQNAAAECHARSKEHGAAFPEIRVEEIWDGYTGPLPPGWPRGGKELALRYELAVNPVYPMPDALETIKALREKNCILGIISNAQFFSPLLFEAFFGAPPLDLGFDPRLLVWSFEEREAKPSPRLFEKAAARLSRLGVSREEALFIGNDMRSDIVPAAQAGFTPVLFAGDKRSLRLRDLLPKPGRPAAVIRTLTELRSLQIPRRIR